MCPPEPDPQTFLKLTACALVVTTLLTPWWGAWIWAVTAGALFVAQRVINRAP